MHNIKSCSGRPVAFNYPAILYLMANPYSATFTRFNTTHLDFNVKKAENLIPAFELTFQFYFNLKLNYELKL